MTSSAEFMEDLQAAIPKENLSGINIRPESPNGLPVEPIAVIEHAFIPKNGGHVAVKGALILDFSTGQRLGVAELEKGDHDKDRVDIALTEAAEERLGLPEAILKGTVKLLKEDKVLRRPNTEVALVDLRDASVTVLAA